jgi:hypothetical protein
MIAAAQKQSPPPARRRYLVHLSCVPSLGRERCGYITRIHPWAGRNDLPAEACERAFEDECELIATINPLLPSGSDIRDVFEHIESPRGFYYLLRLSREEAAQLGWCA